MDRQMSARELMDKLQLSRQGGAFQSAESSSSHDAAAAYALD